MNYKDRKNQIKKWFEENKEVSSVKSLARKIFGDLSGTPQPISYRTCLLAVDELAKEGVLEVKDKIINGRNCKCVKLKK